MENIVVCHNEHILIIFVVSHDSRFNDLGSEGMF